MRAMSSAQQSEVKAWEEEILACEHTLTLEQTPFINPDDPCKLIEGRESGTGAYDCSTDPVYRVRPQGESLAVSRLWTGALREEAVWRGRWEWACIEA